MLLLHHNSWITSRNSPASARSCTGWEGALEIFGIGERCHRRFRVAAASPKTESAGGKFGGGEIQKEEIEREDACPSASTRCTMSQVSYDTRCHLNLWLQCAIRAEHLHSQTARTADCPSWRPKPTPIGATCSKTQSSVMSAIKASMSRVLNPPSKRSINSSVVSVTGLFSILNPFLSLEISENADPKK